MSAKFRAPDSDFSGHAELETADGHDDGGNDERNDQALQHLDGNRTSVTRLGDLLDFG